jgi:hypothetical protein
MAGPPQGEDLSYCLRGITRQSAEETVFSHLAIDVCAVPESVKVYPEEDDDKNERCSPIINYFNHPFASLNYFVCSCDPWADGLES